MREGARHARDRARPGGRARTRQAEARQEGPRAGQVALPLLAACTAVGAAGRRSEAMPFCLCSSRKNLLEFIVSRVNRFFRSIPPIFFCCCESRAQAGKINVS